MLALLVSAGGCLADGTVADYLKIRKSHHIVQPISPQALDEFMGVKLVEFQGLIQGSFKSEETVSFMMQLPGGETQIVECHGNPPDWLLNGEVAARVLATASRSSEHGELVARFIAAAPESSIERVDEAYWRREANKPAAKRSGSTSSRSSGGLYRWVGKTKPSQSWVLPYSQATPQYAAFIKKCNPSLSNERAFDIARAVIGFSLHFGVEARLVMAVLLVESGFDPGSTSNHGAMGLGQLMPGTAAWMGVRNPYDTTDNLYGTVKLLRTHLDQYRAQTGEDFSALVLALAAYNAGEGAVKRHGGVPPYRETQAYINRVIQIYARLCGR